MSLERMERIGATSDLSASTTDTAATARPISHPTYSGPIIKHIPRSVWSHITNELIKTINNVISDPDDPSVWSSLLSFVQRCFMRPHVPGVALVWLHYWTTEALCRVSLSRSRYLTGINGPALVTTLTALINLLMTGKCPSSVTLIFCGGWLTTAPQNS